jgi:RimJ/RimL family protein N-acetyltransferase
MEQCCLVAALSFTDCFGNIQALIVISAYEAAHAYFDYLFREKDARRIYAYTEDYNLPSQRLCERLGMRREGLFMEFVSFVNNPDGTPLYENTYQYAVLKKEWL